MPKSHFEYNSRDRIEYLWQRKFKFRRDMMLRHEKQIKISFSSPNNRNQDPKQRKVYVKMHDDVIDAGGDVKIFSSMHVSGERKFQ